MDASSQLITAMANQCRGAIVNWHTSDLNLPRSLRPARLRWMCDMIEAHADDWPATKLHRWIGFVQCALMANRMLDVDEAKAMLESARVAHGEVGEDLLDHLDPDSSFRLDIGGEG